MINFRTEILNALPIPDFFTWWWNNWSGTGFHVWADELLEMGKEGIVKIERGRVEVVHNGTGIAEGRFLKDKSFNLAQTPIELQMIN